jgi:hypothetical protein
MTLAVSGGDPSRRHQRPVADRILQRVFLHDVHGRLEGLKRGAERLDLWRVLLHPRRLAPG